MVRFLLATNIFFLLLGACNVVSLSLDDPSPRRRFLEKLNHGTGLSLIAVAGLLENPQKAVAYERRDVGGADRSAITAAYNEQAFLTNNRLEASGFHLDTREEEKTRLSDAMASFSYESATTSSKKTGLVQQAGVRQNLQNQKNDPIPPIR
jgi:hypothetical protein